MKRNFYAAVVLAAVCLSSCKKDEEPGRNISACGVRDPARNLSWLKEMIEDEKRHSPGFLPVIRMFEYKGETYFDYTNSLMSCIVCNIYDCSGNRLTPMDIFTDEKEYPGFVEMARGKSTVVIWSGK